jgi:hypothetical protein
VRVRQCSGLAIIAIEDDGNGVSPETIEEITRPFFTTRRSQGGCGLGASIAEGIIRGHGGTLRCYHASGVTGVGFGGLLINIVLPLNRDSWPDAREPKDNCVLISDDWKLIGDFSAICGNLGLKPLVAKSLREWDKQKGPARQRLILIDGEIPPNRTGEIPQFGIGPDRRVVVLGSPLGRKAPGILCEETLSALSEDPGFDKG